MNLLLLTEHYDSESIHVFDFLYLFDKEKEEQKKPTRRDRKRSKRFSIIDLLIIVVVIAMIALVVSAYMGGFDISFSSPPS